MATQMILGLTGFSGTGKSTIAEYLAKKHGFYIFEGSTLMRQAAVELGIVLSSRSTYETFFRRIQQERGLSWISDAMLATGKGRLLQVGLRSPSDAARIHQANGKVLALTCPPEICIARMDKDNPKNPTTLHEYVEHQQIESSTDEYGSHTAWVIEHADYVIETSGPINSTFARIDTIVAGLKIPVANTAQALDQNVL